MHALVIGRPPPPHLSKSPGSSLTCTIVHACLAWRVQDKNLKGGFFKQMSNKLKPSRQGADYPDIGEPAAVQYDQVNNNYGGFDNAANMRSPGRAPRVSGNPGGGGPPVGNKYISDFGTTNQSPRYATALPQQQQQGGWTGY